MLLALETLAETPVPAQRSTEAGAATRKSAPLATQLATHGLSPAVITSSHEVLSYAELATRVRRAGELLGEQRRLVLLEASNRLDCLTWYLAALAEGHPVLVIPAGNRRRTTGLVEVYDPDVVISEQAGEYRVTERRPYTIHDFHPDLALLLSTSGSTGSPKLVRLSYDNIASNAAAIAEYLSITCQDRAITSLPMSYCYGLSVIHSHLLAGATLLLTDQSVVDPSFWEFAREFGTTSLAAVPYTFELMEKAGYADPPLPSLRYITQAGGRMPANRVREYSERGHQQGWNLWVMYGQTEATARMAYLPPKLALKHSESGST